LTNTSQHKTKPMVSIARGAVPKKWK